MKQVSFFIKIGCAGLGFIGGLIAMFTGFGIDAFYGFIGLALLGTCGFFVGYTLENANFKELFPPKAPKYPPQGYIAPQNYSNTQGYTPPQGFSNTQSYDAPQQPVSAGQQSFNDSLNSANQAYASNQKPGYSFDTPADPQ